MNLKVNEIVQWLRTRLTAAPASGLAVGLSGGLGSAVVLRLCQLASPEQVLGMIMPCKNG